MRHRPSFPAILAALVCAALLQTNPLLADGLNLRMQRVLAQFVEETGHSVMSVGSWVSGLNFNPATSDFDMRLVLAESKDEVQPLLQWQQARRRLASLIRTEFGSDAASVLARANLYPPNQLMAGVENAADAIERFQRLNSVPNLSYTDRVTASTPAKYTEGLYGAGSQTYVQGYERTAGRLFYSNNGRCVTGLSEMAHLGEKTATYSAAGTANTAGQWAEHGLVELEAGHGDKVAKFLDRLERDLIKSRSMSGLPLDEGYRAELRNMRALLKNSPGRTAEVAGDVARLLSRGRAEAAILASFEDAGPMRRAYLRVMLDGVAAGNKLGKLVDQVIRKAPSWVDADNLMRFVTISIGTHAAAKSLGSGDDVFEAMGQVFGAINPFRMIGPALLAETMAEIMVQARANGYDMAAGFQDAWDLMAGNYSAWGRAGVDPDPRHTLTLADMVARFHYEKQLEALVMSQAIRASTRGLGTANAQSDNGVAQAIFERCWPPIRDAWRWERDSLTSEYLKLASGAVHVPLVLYFKPTRPPTGAAINAEAVSADQKLGNRLERMKQIIGILYGPGSGVAVNYYWDPAGEGEAGRGWQRTFSFAEPGKYPVKVRLEISPFTPHTQAEKRVLLRRDVEALVDIEVEGERTAAAPATGTSARLTRQYVNAHLTFFTPIATYSMPGPQGLDIGTAAGDAGFPVDCTGKLTGTTFSCSGRLANSSKTKTVKGTFVLNPAGNMITSFSFEEDTVDFTGVHWMSKAAGVNVPLTEAGRDDWDAYSVMGAEVCRHMKVANWTEVWGEGRATVSSYSCNAGSKLVIGMAVR